MSHREHDPIDWRLTRFEGVRREQLRRWSELPLERIVAALEEMERYAESAGNATNEEDTPEQSIGSS